MVVTGACGSGTALLPQLFEEITLGRGNETFLPGASTHRARTVPFPSPFLRRQCRVVLARASCVLVDFSSLDKEKDLQVGKVNLHNCV